MQYILSEEEYNSGCDLMFAWKEENIEIGNVLEKTISLNKQGYFTLANCVDMEKEIYEIYVFQKT